MPERQGGVILFDGTCAFCERAVRFIATRDHGYFQFGASQNPEGRALLEQFGTTREAAKSIILIDDDRIYLRSDAVLRIAGTCPRRGNGRACCCRYRGPFATWSMDWSRRSGCASPGPRMPARFRLPRSARGCSESSFAIA